MNTLFKFLYRDASNYKRINAVVLEGTLTEEAKSEILEKRSEGLYFIPEQVGIEADRIDDEPTEDDHCWCELDEDDAFEETEAEANAPVTARELYEAFMNVEFWDDVEYAYCAIAF